MPVGVDQHRHGAPLDQEHQHRSAEQHDAERGDERDQGDRFGLERVGDGREDLAHAALEQIGDVAAEQDGDHDRGADDRHREQHLEGGLRDELNRDRLPVRQGEQRAALEQQLEVQIDFTIAPVYSGEIIVVRSLLIRLARRLALIAGVGLTCAALTGVGGGALLRSRLGESAAASFDRVEAEVRQQFDASAASLAAISGQVGAARDLIRAAPHDVSAAPALFDVLDAGDSG